MSDKERKDILFNIYHHMFRYDGAKEEFARDWGYVYSMLKDGCEDEVPDAILQMVKIWMDTL